VNRFFVLTSVGALEKVLRRAETLSTEDQRRQRAFQRKDEVVNSGCSEKVGEM